MKKSLKGNLRFFAYEYKGKIDGFRLIFIEKKNCWKIDENYFSKCILIPDDDLACFWAQKSNKIRLKMSDLDEFTAIF